MQDESSLLKRARRGDRAAFRELVERHQDRLYGLALDLTGDHHAAEDLTQETFVRMYQRVETLRGEAQLFTWLYRVTVNLYLDGRRRHAATALEFREQLDDVPGAHQSADAALDLHAGLGVLSPRERAVFVLRQEHGWTLARIGEELEIAEGTVKSLAFRALKKLARRLADYDETEDHG